MKNDDGVEWSGVKNALGKVGEKRKKERKRRRKKTVLLSLLC